MFLVRIGCFWRLILAICLVGITGFPLVAAAEESPLLARFFSATAEMDRGDYGAAATSLEQVKARSVEASYQNLTELSFQLLARAERAKGAGKEEEAAFLARWAEKLSPGDARIQLELAKFASAFEGRGFLSRAWSALLLLPSHPYLSAAISGTMLLVILVATTLGMLLVEIIQLLRHGDSLLEGLGKIFPYPWRGFGALGLLALLLSAPLAGGLLCAVACWALLLTRYVAGCKRFSLHAGVLCLTWGLAIPVIGAARVTLASDLFRAMEEIQNDAYVPRAESVMAEPSRGSQNEPLVSFLLGVVRYREGALKAAEANFTQAAQGASAGGLRRAAQVNLGATMLRLGDLKGGKETLERAEAEGVTSFELYYNLSQAHLQLLDTEAARRYSQLALSSNRGRLTELESANPAGSGAHVPLLQRAPTTSLLPQLLRTTLVGTVPAAVLQRNDVRTGRLAALLLVSGRTETIVLLGLLSFALGWFAAHKAKHSGAERAKAETSPSLVWYVLPGGGFVASERPMLGALVLTAVIACVLLAFGAPVRPLPGVPVATGAVPILMIVASTIFLIGVGGAVWLGTSEKGER